MTTKDITKLNKLIASLRSIEDEIADLTVKCSEDEDDPLFEWTTALLPAGSSIQESLRFLDDILEAKLHKL